MQGVNSSSKNNVDRKAKTIYVISGTHWDREWRYSAEQSLLRLSELGDSLLDILEKNQDYVCFHLDGGTVVLEDYLAIRPENASRLQKLIEQKRIATVMWYTLPEMSSVAPEALIRNLLIGKRLADAYGGPMRTGYTATSYGQISQLPQIYSGFGIKTALSYRGTNKHQVPPICAWESPDGSQIYHIRCFDEATRTNWFFFVHYELVLGRLPRDLRTKWNAKDWPVHMCDPQTYQTAFQFCDEKFEFEKDRTKVLDAIRHFVKQATPQEISDCLLALDMEDNASPYCNLPQLIKTANDYQNDYLIRQSSLDNYVDTVVKKIDKESLAVQKGEMRYTGIELGFNGLLGMTSSSRMILKLLNSVAEAELIRVAEPLSSFSAFVGGSYQHALLHRAWLDLLKNHAHDSICGAAINEAHKDNPTRFRTVCAIARECSRKASEELWCKIDTKTGFKDGDITITVFNTLPSRLTGVHEAIIDVPNIVVGDYLIEPCSGAGPVVEGFEPDKLITYDHFDIYDEGGNKTAFTVLEKTKIDMEVERKLDSNAAAYQMVRNKMLIDVDIPPFGYRTYALRPRSRNYITHPSPSGDRSLIAQHDGVLENEYVRISINSNGTFDMTNKESGRTLKGVHYFCDDGSTGNAHMRQTPMRNMTVTTLCSSPALTLVENGVLRATWKIDWVLQIPAAVDENNIERSEHLVKLPITSWLTLRKGSRQVEIKTRVRNAARDHRLRIMVPTDIHCDFVDVEGPFDVLKRQVQWNKTGDNMERHYECQPTSGFISVSDGTDGVSFLGRGLGEYEVVDDKRRTLAITMLRCHRAYMLATRGDMTPEERAAQDGQHNIGDIEFEYALMMHSGMWNKVNLLDASLRFRTPYRIIQGVPKAGILPATKSFISLESGGKIQFSALYARPQGDGFTLRIWNSSHNPAQATIEFFMPLKSIIKTSMDEERDIEILSLKDGKCVVSLRQAEIATFFLQM